MFCAVVVSGCMYFVPSRVRYPTRVVQQFQLTMRTAREVWRSPLDRAGDERLTSVAFLPDGERLLVGNAKGDIAMWRIGASGADSHFSDAPQRVECLAVSPDGSLLVTASMTEYGSG